ncbi:hypothetical protein AB0942_33190 [Streptomyces nodosus]
MDQQTADWIVARARQMYERMEREQVQVRHPWWRRAWDALKRR